ncbi:TonB-dependent receptor domain-containing protein [Sphingosinicella soli]|uniref:Outer membrane receptor protein involved in Fe transport n=1 Tax=Sphingosinicella soli TaxID=333708 RepID=A0A7W7AZB3_9SPHN|nr:TonB-dependent receptor [Sphingosinicella soli]MBB4631141.1 outer membrane receptor protein involved in Fe transport [Sphingosinicella soli]
MTLCAISPAFAQSSGTPPARTIDEEIVVTGSLLARSGFDAPTPVTAIGTEDLLRVNAPDISNVVNQMPAVRASLTPASTGNLSSLAAGNYIDLRGLGYLRTQVLIDGRRYSPNTPSGGVNVSSIPQTLVRGIDIVTGGASAAYGSDAVAGVVNFLIDDEFQGLKGKVQGGITDHNDYRNYLASVAYGTNFADNRIRLTVAVEAAQNSGIDFIGDRDWGNNPSRIANPAWTATNDEPRNLVVMGAKAANVAYGGVINSPGALRGLQFAPDGSAIPFNYGSLVTTSSMVGGDGVNATADNVGSVPSERYAAFGRLTFDATDSLKIFAEINYSKIQSRFPTLSRTEQLTIRADNPFIPESVRDVMISEGIPSFVMGRSLNDYARGDIDMDIDTLQAVFGAEGSFGDSWKWDAYYSHGRTKNVLHLEQRVTSRFALALDAVTDPNTGAAACRSTLTNPGNGCVPINLIGEGNVTDAALNYINGMSRREWDIKQNIVAGTVRGEPFSTWAGPVGVAVGAEYRSWKVDTTSDPISQVQGYLGGGTIPYSGKIEVKEVFGEILVPLASGESWARDLSLNLAGRITDYSTSGTVETWKAGVNYAINDSIRLRATRSRDIRAPGLEELFAAGSTSTLSVQDPEFGGESYSVQAANTGNPTLTPEKADTLTAGIVLTPDFLPGFKFSVDYYDIKMKNAIIALTPATIVDQCYTTAPQLCSLITRGGDGRITRVLNGPVNLQRVQVRGIDFESSYRFPLGAGDINLRALATYIDKAVIDDGITASELHDAVNQPTIAALGGNPRWRFNTSASYITDQARLSVTGRYVGGGRIDPSFTSKDLDVLRVKGRLYFDISGEYAIIERGESTVALFGSIQNLLDQNPPITGVGGYGTTRSLYDTIGRIYNVGVRFQF